MSLDWPHQNGQIGLPIERALNGTPGLLIMRSKSTFGLSLITLVFRDGIETYWSRLRINERIQNVTLPPGISAGLDPVTSPTGQIFYYTVESDTKGIRELSEIERWVVIPALKQVPGIADVSNFGGITTQFQLELDPEQLTRFNISLKNITDAISANSANSGGSVMTRGELGYVIRGIGLIQSLDDMGNVIVTQKNGTPILVRDLGKLKLSNQERHGVLGKDDKNDSIAGHVLLLRGENPSRVLDGLTNRIIDLMGARLQERAIWQATKAVYSSLIAQSIRFEIAESFFNSLTRRVFATEGVDQAIEFVDTDFDVPPSDASGASPTGLSPCGIVSSMSSSSAADPSG
jgi:cobalt-zinc-cadmium resistance protein CzcA